MAQAWTANTLAMRETSPTIRRIGVHEIGLALREGYADFKAIPTQLVFLCLLYPVIGLVAARVASGDAMPLLFPLVAGLSLMGPVLAIGMYELSRRREAGLPVTWLNAFDVFRSPAIVGILALGFMLLVLFSLWVLFAKVIFTLTIGETSSTTLSGFLTEVRAAPGFKWLFLLGNFVGFLFAVVVLAVSAISFPMMLDRLCSPAIAVQTSIRAVAGNPRTMAIWGLIVAALLVVGCVPLFIGLAVVMPILGHATWHLYRHTVE